MERFLLLFICIFATFCHAETQNTKNFIETRKHWKNGFVLYCPCMGRFGNQADQFLGALSFAKHLNRMLVLPPWITYDQSISPSQRVPFDTWFNITSLEDYHQVMTMEKFMADIAPFIWPPGKRIGFCYSFRGKDDKCRMKEGNPFGPFWDHFDVNFDSYVEHTGLLFETDFLRVRQAWNEKFPNSKYPVLAFMGAPGSFPVADRNRELQKYLKWSTTIDKIADKFIKDVLPKGPFVGIHLRTGSDMKSACELLKEGIPKLFASQQCTGYDMKYKLMPEMCFPSERTIATKTRQLVKKHNATSVFIATDSNPMLQAITKELKKLEWPVAVHQRKLGGRDAAIIDLAILTKADLFIGNCVSSFSSFVKRTRDVIGKPSAFWAFDPATSPMTKDEL